MDMPILYTFCKIIKKNENCKKISHNTLCIIIFYFTCKASEHLQKPSVNLI